MNGAHSRSTRSASSPPTDCAAATASSTPRSTSCERSSIASPASVSSTRCVERRSSSQPSAFSSARIWRLSAGWVMYRRSAARPKLSSAATATNARRWRSSTASGAVGNDSVTDRLCRSCTTVMPDRPFPFGPPSRTIRGMGKLIESTFVTFDGVISDPGAWGSPYWDDEHSGYAGKLVEDADALLLGRETYEAFTKAWPQRGDDLKINQMPKYVASRTLTETTWNASLLEGEAPEAVRALKQRPEPAQVRHRRVLEHAARAPARRRVPLLGLPGRDRRRRAALRRDRHDPPQAPGHQRVRVRDRRPRLRAQVVLGEVAQPRPGLEVIGLGVRARLARAVEVAAADVLALH